MGSGKTVAVAGAGMVGLCTALSLLERGYAVTLVDRDEPLQKASRWNAGVLATSSLWPMVNPGLPRAALGLATGRSPGFRINPACLGAALPFGLRALRAARAPGFEARVAALDRLIGLSRTRHDALIEKVKCTAQVNDNGWLFLFETSAALAAARAQMETFAAHGVAHEVIGRDGLADLEPHLAPRFEHGIWLTGSAWVRDPAMLGAAYMAHFGSLGGKLLRAEVAGLDFGVPALRLGGGERLAADHVVLAAGPWTGTLLARAGLRLPMVGERGYLRRVAPVGNAGLERPVHDTAGGIVLSPRPDGIQISTGTELCLPGAPKRARQAREALERARLLLPLGEQIGPLESAERPTLPDTLPAIGPLAGAPGVWLATGHQHIGFSTSAGTGELIAEGIAGAALPGWAAPFAPARFGL